MKTELILQEDGGSTIESHLRRITAQSVRIASAYVSFETINLLARFPRAKRTLLFDFTPSRLTAALLNALLQALPNRIFVAYRAGLFHPKLYIFESARTMNLFVGSSNATAGGLRNNVETMFHHELDRRYDAVIISEIENLWKRLAQIASERLTSQLISEHSAELAADLPRENRPRGARRRLAPKTIVVPFSLPDTLEKVVGNETGAYGTQVQFPVETITNYFGNDGYTNAKVDVIYRGKTYATQITHHPNNTHRIVLSFLANVPRPALLKLVRVAGPVYRATVYRSNSPQYGALVRRGEARRRGANPYVYY